MKRISAASPWIVFRRKLKERYEQLTDADFSVIDRDRVAWLEHLRRVIRRSTFEIAQLADEATDEAVPRVRRQIFVADEEWRFRVWLTAAMASKDPEPRWRPASLSKEKARRAN